MMASEESRRAARQLLAMPQDELKVEAVAIVLDVLDAARASAEELRALDREMLDRLLPTE